MVASVSCGDQGDAHAPQGGARQRDDQRDELLLAQPDLLCEGDLPKDHLFAGRHVIAMRQAANKESRRRRSRAPTARQRNVRETQPCERREATSYRAMPVATAALRDSTVDAIGIDTI